MFCSPSDTPGCEYVCGCECMRECVCVHICLGVCGESQVTPLSFYHTLQYITVTANLALFQIV